MPVEPSRTARIRALARSDRAAALRDLTSLLQDLFKIDPQGLEINDDQYSLNSLNGFFDTSDGAFFFKFHQEEGEEDMRGEYYRADLLAAADLPVDMPVMTSTLPGEQVLVYRRRNDPRFSDVLRALDANRDAARAAQVVAAERALNDRLCAVAMRTLHPVTVDEVQAEPIHRLFHDRMIDPVTGAVPGGRYKRFYVDQVFDLPGAQLAWADLSEARLVLNGQAMAMTLGQIFAAAVMRLAPARLAGAGGIVAHGDAHNANVWFNDPGGQAPHLSYFDPAFAGSNVPSLLAEAKATFHNVFAHPFWLYDPTDATARFSAHVRHAGGTLSIETDWALPPLRRDLLNAKADAYWAPFLRHLAARGLLPKDWRATLRAALAMCPALVMSLRAAPGQTGGAGQHTPVSSAIGLMMVGLTGSPPVSGGNVVADFLDRIDPVTGG